MPYQLLGMFKIKRFFFCKICTYQIIQIPVFCERNSSVKFFHGTRPTDVWLLALISSVRWKSELREKTSLIISCSCEEQNKKQIQIKFIAFLLNLKLISIN